MTVRILLITFAYLISAVELVLAVYFWKTNSGSTIRKVIGFLLLSTSLWVGTTAASVYRSAGELSDLLAMLVYVFGVFGLSLLLHFLLVYPLPIFRISALKAVVLYTPAVILSILLLFTKTIVRENVFGPDYYGHSVPGSLFIVYNLYLFALFLTILTISFRRWYPQTSFHRANAKLVFWSIVLGGVPTVLLDVIATSLFKVNPSPLYGVLTNVVWVAVNDEMSKYL